MQGSSGAPQDNTEKRISDDAAKTLQNILNAVRTSLEDEFAIQQMEYDEIYGVESEEFERYQIQVADWLRENRLVDAVVDMLPLSCFMNSPASAQQVSPDPQQQQYQDPQYQDPQQQQQYQEPEQEEPQYQEQQYQEQQQQEAQPQAPVHSYDEQSTSYVNMQPPPTSVEAPMPPAFAPPPPPEPEPAAAAEQGAGWPEQPWGPPPGKAAEPEQPSSTMQGNPWAQSDDDSGWYTGAAPDETTQTQDVAGSNGEVSASQWSQPQWNSSVEPASNQNDGFQSGGWAAVEEEPELAPEPEPEPEPYTSAPPSPFAAPATAAEYEPNSEPNPEPIPEPASPTAPAPPPGWTALEPAQAQAPAPAPATGWGAPEPAQTTGWASPEQEPAPSWPPAPDLSSVPESAAESAPSWPQAPEALPQPQPEPAPVFQSIPVSAAAPAPSPVPAPDQSVQQQPAPVPDPKKGEESEEDYTYDPTTAWG